MKIAIAGSSPLQNHVLAALPSVVYQHWLPLLECVDLPLGHVLYESGNSLNHVYFPTTAIVSMLYVRERGDSAEVAIVGTEGLIGVSLFMGGGSSHSLALVQNAGRAYRLPAAFAKQQFEDCKPVMQVVVGFTLALIAQMAQTVAGNKHRSPGEPVCR